MSRLLLLLFILANAQFCKAQDSASGVHLNAGVIYNSGLNYYGRIDSLHSKGICPFVGLSLKNGLYLNSTFVFIENSLQSQYAATLLEAGYNFGGNDNSKHWAGNLSVSRFFYQQDIDLVESVIKEMGSASLTQLNNVANITLTGSARYSDRMDYNLQAGLDHIIRIPGALNPNGVLVLDPTVTASAGTQNFTNTYYQQKYVLFLPAQQQQITTSSQQFNLLAYELSCPIVYGIGKIKLLVTPACVLPQNIIAGSETATNLFYLTAMVKITL